MNTNEPPPPASPGRRQSGRPSVVMPVTLIALGLIFLLQNLGLLPWSVWGTLWQLWPVWLIGAGFDLLIGRRSVLGSVLVAIALLATIGISLWYGALPSSRQLLPTTSVNLRQPLDGAAMADVSIAVPIGRLQLDATGEAGILASGTVTTFPGQRVRSNFSRGNNMAYLHLGAEGFPHAEGGLRGGLWDLFLTDAVPIRLSVDSDVGEVNLNLQALTLTELKLDAGVSKSTIILPAMGVYRARIDGGIGQVTVHIPAGIAAQIRISTGIGPVNVYGPFNQSGNVYTSFDYSTAVHRADIEVDGGIGAITIHSGTS